MTETAGPIATTCTAADGVVLEAELDAPSGARAGVVLCHPHPQHGGTMRSLVPSVLFGGLPAAGIAALRFNFRGVEGSSGAYGDGVAEQLDVVAAIDALAEACPGVPLAVAGWSFGAEVASAVADGRLAGWVLIALPMRILERGTHAAGTDPRPKLVLQPEHDQFRRPDALAPLIESWEATTTEVIGGADHFLVGRTDRVLERTIAFVEARCDAARDPI